MENKETEAEQLGVMREMSMAQDVAGEEELKKVTGRFERQVSLAEAEFREEEQEHSRTREEVLALVEEAEEQAEAAQRRLRTVETEWISVWNAEDEKWKSACEELSAMHEELMTEVSESEYLSAEKANSSNLSGAMEKYRRIELAREEEGRVALSEQEAMREVRPLARVEPSAWAWACQTGGKWSRFS